MTYDELVASGRLKQRQVEVYVVLFSRRRQEDGMTAREIGTWMKTGVMTANGDHSGVHSRLRELEAQGLVAAGERRRCTVSGRQARVWRVK